MIKLILIIAVILLFGLIVMYNKKVMTILAGSKTKSENIFYRILGQRVKNWNIRVERAASIKKDTWTYKINNYFKEIIVNMDMSKDNVTPVGLIVFISTISLSFSIVFVVWLQEYSLAVPAFCAVFYFIVVVFRFMSLMRYEKKEANIMDVEDLIAMDVKGGVYNAILRYRHSFHPSMRPYFEDFIDNIQNKGYGFKESMLILNDKLGSTFTDFAQKAIMYEEKADKDMDDIFTAIVEINRFRRTLRYESNKKFDKLRLEFIISIGIIAFYCVFSVFSDPFLSYFFTKTFFGKLLIIIDIVVVTAVLGYISSIKAKFL